MKYVLNVVFCALLLFCPALRGQSVLTLSTDDVQFLNKCGVLQSDINVIPNLPSSGQAKILAVLHKHNRACKNLQFFKDCRDALRKFTPPPSVLPSTPKGWSDYDLLTSAEKDYVLNVEADYFAKAILGNRQK
ncbi:MAG: hypothetical protein WCA89_17800 [Terracidiphilus sp.]|jgi:hypothetical protein